ncbi:hypothetical protein C8Q77DRAFT_928499 [Trametes polyzona]|nr:hypothetical protein C8Q77DRAFT_928499 [Trametes polyzona]
MMLGNMLETLRRRKHSRSSLELGKPEWTVLLCYSTILLPIGLSYSAVVLPGAEACKPAPRRFYPSSTSAARVLYGSGAARMECWMVSRHVRQCRRFIGAVFLGAAGYYGVGGLRTLIGLDDD